MKARLNFVALIVILGSKAAAQADGPQAKSAELQVLDRYVGSWEETVVIKPALWTPERRTSTTRRWILNEQMIENKGIESSSQQHFVDKDTFTWTHVAKDKTGQVVLDMEAKCVRKK